MRDRTMNRRRAAAPGLLALACAMLAGPGAPALAQTSPYYIGASQSLGQESNLLGLSNDQPTPPGFSKSDTVSITSLLGGIDQAVGRYRVYGTLALRANRYAQNKSFDYEGYNFAGGLDWSTAERVSGTLSASANRGLQNFNTAETGVLTRKNIETTESLEAIVRVGLVTQYSLEGVAGRRKVSNSLNETRVQAQAYSENRLSLGLRWRPSSTANFGIALRGTQGEYPNLQVDAGGGGDTYQGRNVDLSATMQVSGASSFDVLLSFGDTRYSNADYRNFSGLTGNAKWIWQISGKLRLDTSLSRATGQDNYAVSVFNTSTTANYNRITDTLRLRADHDLSAKFALNTTISYSHQDLVRTIENPFVPLNASGRENITVLAFGGRWTPTRGSLLGCDGSTERRSGSGQLGYDLKAGRFSCYAQLTVQ